MALFPDDLVDTRTIIDRIEELESDHTDDDDVMTGVGLWDTADRIEYQGLTEMTREIGEQACRDGMTLIHERYFSDYVKELYSDIGGEYHEVIPKSYGRMRHVPLDEMYSRMPFKHIDWDAVASEEERDYSRTEIDGATYYYQEH